MNLSNKITINYWFKKFHKRPLYYSIGIFSLIWFVFSFSFYLFIKNKQASIVSQTADLLSISLQTNNRILSEALIDTLLSQHHALSAKVCDKEIQILGMNTTTKDCSLNISTTDFLYSSLIPGTRNSLLIVEFSFFKSMSNVFYILSFCIIVFLFVFYFINKLTKKIQSDIIKPLVSNLLSSDELRIVELEDLRKKVIMNTELQSQKATTLAIQENNLKVAHDIRSPVTTLEELLSLIDINNIQIKTSILKSITRIKNISNHLLQEQKQISNNRQIFKYNLHETISDMITEKQVLHPSFLFNLKDNKIVFVNSYLATHDLLRILSNIVDNAVRASNKIKKIDINLSLSQNYLNIQVTDYGSGIKSENLKKIGTKFFTTEDSGSGLGIYTAKKTLEYLGGTLKIDSIQGEGSTVTIQIPAAPSELESNSTAAILIDNDELVRDTWSMLAAKEQLNLVTFSSYNDFISNVKSLNKLSPVFIDSDLGSNIKGEDKVIEITALGFSKIILQSGYSFSKKPKGITKVIGKSFLEALEIIKTQSNPTT